MRSLKNDVWCLMISQMKNDQVKVFHGRRKRYSLFNESLNFSFWSFLFRIHLWSFGSVVFRAAAQTNHLVNAAIKAWSEQMYTKTLQKAWMGTIFDHGIAFFQILYMFCLSVIVNSARYSINVCCIMINECGGGLTFHSKCGWLWR